MTRVTLPDEDAGPTKAWLVSVGNDPEWKEHFQWVYGRRPREELYDLRVVDWSNSHGYAWQAN